MWCKIKTGGSNPPMSRIRTIGICYDETADGIRAVLSSCLTGKNLK